MNNKIIKEYIQDGYCSNCCVKPICDMAREENDCACILMTFAITIDGDICEQCTKEKQPCSAECRLACPAGELTKTELLKQPQYAIFFAYSNEWLENNKCTDEFKKGFREAVWYLQQKGGKS